MISNKFLAIFAIIAISLSTYAYGKRLLEKEDRKLINNSTQTSASDNSDKKVSRAVFAAGCFWCSESTFESMTGVNKVISGYTGGHTKHPTYEEVTSGTTGHYEAVEVHFDPTLVSYAQLVDAFWKQIDPTDDGGSFVDRGSQYRSAIFYADELQKKIAEQSKKTLNQSGKFSQPVVTEILPLAVFYPAEEYHQDYYKKNATHYKLYRKGSGRDTYIEKTWKAGESIVDTIKGNAKTTLHHLKEKLTPLQYYVTQENGTERPFENEYWNNKREGIYVDVVSGEPLFSSKEKYDSGSGWPSFYKPLVTDNITSHSDDSLGMRRVEVRSKSGNSHLGHVFEDGPNPTGLRYCINSSALRFIPKEDLKKEGYGDYLKLFER